MKEIILIVSNLKMYERVMEYCKRENLTVSAFEKTCKLGNGAVSKWRDESYPTMKTLAKIEKATGIPIVRWIGGEDIARSDV